MKRSQARTPMSDGGYSAGCTLRRFSEKRRKLRLQRFADHESFRENRVMPGLYCRKTGVMTGLHWFFGRSTSQHDKQTALFRQKRPPCHGLAWPHYFAPGIIVHLRQNRHQHTCRHATSRRQVELEDQQPNRAVTCRRPAYA